MVVLLIPIVIIGVYPTPFFASMEGSVAHLVQQFAMTVAAH
jgi:NADH:ubiquinone oxidoreductase subunit 4 (subunit M)